MTWLLDGKKRQHNRQFSLKLLSCHLTTQTKLFWDKECLLLLHILLFNLENKEHLLGGRRGQSFLFLKCHIPFLNVTLPRCSIFMYLYYPYTHTHCCVTVPQS